MTRSTAAGLVAVVALGLSACESTQDKAARLRHEGKTVLAGRQGLKVGAENPDVKVLGRTILHDANGTAAVVELRNVGRAAMAQVPIGIRLDDAKGNRLFANDAPGLEPGLVSVPLLPKGRAAFWVNNQVVTTTRPRRLEVRVGPPRPAAVPARPPHIALAKIRLEHDTDGTFVTGVVRNRSTVLQRRLTIFCVARRRGRIVAAGRAVIDKLPPTTRKPTRFTVYFIGNPKGATLDFSVPPVNLR